jgi:hypothetical protein
MYGKISELVDYNSRQVRLGVVVAANDDGTVEVAQGSYFPQSRMSYNLLRPLQAGESVVIHNPNGSGMRILGRSSSQAGIFNSVSVSV